MWILRFLNGPMAGQIVPLTKHSTLIGRSPTCDIKIASANISKEHTRIEIFDDKVILTDAGSRNGTFVNGVQVRSSKAKSGDKVAIHDIYFEVQKVPESWAARYQQQQQFAAAPGYGAPPRPATRNYTQNEEPLEEMPGQVPRHSPLDRVPQLQSLVQEYLDRVVLPGLFRLPESFDFKYVLGGFMGLFIIMVTMLSIIPMVQILKANLQEESQQHAMTIATTLARVNRPFLTGGQESGASVEVATSRPGVKKAYIISNIDGNIVAPASQAASYPDIPFVHEARKLGKEVVKQVDDSTVVAMYPIQVFNQDTGVQAVTHWAVVMYDMKNLAINDGQVLSLFITTLFFALILGAILFFFLYKIIEHPILEINRQLDLALKENGETVSVTYQFPALQLMASNVSSALTRAVNGAADAGAASGRGLEHDRNREIANLVQLQAFAAMGVRAHDLSIAAVNPALETRLNMSAFDLTSKTVTDLGDQSLRLSIKDLIERVEKNPDEIASNNLEFSGNTFQIVTQAIYGSNKISYYLVVLLPQGDES